MDISLNTRIEEAKKVISRFNLDQQKIADYAGRNRVTISRVLNANDERYVTDSNISAIESAINKILDEYRKELCGKTV